MNPFDKTVFLSLTVRMLGISRKVSTDAVEVDTDKDMLRVSKKILDCDEYKAVGTAVGNLKKYLRNRSVPGVNFLKGGIFPIPLTRITEVNCRLDELCGDYDKAVESFCAAYYGRVEQAKSRLASLYENKDYPPLEEVRKSFGIQRVFITIGPPTSLSDVDSELYRKEYAKVQQQCQEAAEGVKQAMRQAFAELLNHMRERLLPGEDGKPKIFKKSLISNFQEFIADFASRNITSDTELAALVSKMQTMLDGKSPDDFRQSADLRTQAVEELTAIKSQLDSMIVNKPKRAMTLEEEAA